MLTLVERPVPTPGPGEILIKVAAAGVNRPDMLQRQGQYQPPPGASDVLGLEVAGEVVALGEGVTLHKLGDDVTALLPGGGYAEYALAHESNALPVPQGLSLIEAAAIPETFFTVWTNVFDRGGLKAGEWLLVHGGASGIGTTAIHARQGVRRQGDRDRRRGRARRRPAASSAPTSSSTTSRGFRRRDARRRPGRGADVILDMVGGDYVARNYAAAAMDGRIVQIAFLQRSEDAARSAAADDEAAGPYRLDAAAALARREGGDRRASAREGLAAAGGRARCKPIIDSTFPLDQADKAHERMESSAHFGKIVLTI